MARVKAKHKLMAISLLITVAIVTGGVLVYSRLSRPVSVNISESYKQSASMSSYNIDLSPAGETDKYVSFEYPRGMTLKNTTLLTPASVADYNFYARDVYSWFLTIDVSSVPGGQLSLLSSYTFREQNPDQYKQSLETVNGQKVVIMSDSQFAGGFSKVAYLSNGQLVGTISLSGDDSSGVGPLQKAFNAVVSSWQWQ